MHFSGADRIMELSSSKTRWSGFRRNGALLLRLLSFLVPYKRLVLLSACMLIIVTIFMFAMPWLVGQAVDSVRGNPANLPLVNNFAEPGTLSYLFLTAIGVVAVGVFRGLFSFWQTYLSQAISQKVAYDVRNQIYSCLQKQSFSFYDRVATADLMSRATADVEAVRMLMSFGLPRPAQVTIFFIGLAAPVGIPAFWKN